MPNQTGWQQTFTYDRYGNRRFDTSNNRTTTLEANCPTAVCNPEVNAQNNRLAGYTFDSAGNTTEDAEDRTFVYDGENKQAEVWENGIAVGRYYYDGDGKRVKKESATETTIFIYDAAGKLVVESSTQTSKDPQVAYLTSDNLGTPRINTNAGGAVIARHDYHPFGEEITGDGRNPGIGYDPDDVRQKFTGKQRDSETELDYFEARYYSSNLGRFSSVDPIGVKLSRLIDPQQLNRYLYVRDNPFKYTDTDGRDIKMDPNLKKVDADTLLKSLVKIYMKPGGREALQKLEKSAITYVITKGDVPNIQDKVDRNKLDVGYGETKPTGGKILSDKVTGKRCGR